MRPGGREIERLQGPADTDRERDRNYLLAGCLRRMRQGVPLGHGDEGAGRVDQSDASKGVISLGQID